MNISFSQLIDADSLDVIKQYEATTPLNSAAILPGKPYVGPKMLNERLCSRSHFNTLGPARRWSRCYERYNNRCPSRSIRDSLLAQVRITSAPWFRRDPPADLLFTESSKRSLHASRVVSDHAIRAFASSNQYNLTLTALPSQHWCLAARNRLRYRRRGWLRSSASVSDHRLETIQLGAMLSSCTIPASTTTSSVKSHTVQTWSARTDCVLLPSSLPSILEVLYNRSVTLPKPQRRNR